MFGLFTKKEKRTNYSYPIIIEAKDGTQRTKYLHADNDAEIEIRVRDRERFRSPFFTHFLDEEGYTIIKPVSRYKIDFNNKEVA